ncbi:MAG: hypothetical protein A2V66_00745 [Ignavibacteria bacterium RBG_13_36_8]|nr:MAG: hypothetical protein A2V66_00745 [Ignavibacteria bacterium RBG_13_36_8]
MIFLPLVALGLTFCDLGKSDNSGFARITITHSGIDWSTGLTGDDVSYDQIDGETIGWCTIGTRIDGLEGIWYRPFNNHFYLHGSGDLSQVQAVQQNMWAQDVCETPLQNGDIWVAECRDGYVKFKVISVGDPNGEWTAEVEYQFSTTTSFD